MPMFYTGGGAAAGSGSFLSMIVVMMGLMYLIMISP